MYKENSKRGEMAMAQVGQIVLYGTEGACIVTEICKMKVGHKREEYYVLRPVHREGATVFVPLNNELLLSKMRPLLRREEIDALIDKVSLEEPLWIEDAAERKAEQLAHEKNVRKGKKK